MSLAWICRVRTIFPMAAKVRPGMLLLKPADIGGHLTGPGLDAAMIGIDRGVRDLGRPCRIFQKQPNIIGAGVPSVAPSREIT